MSISSMQIPINLRDSEAVNLTGSLFAFERFVALLKDFSVLCSKGISASRPNRNRRASDIVSLTASFFGFVLLVEVLEVLYSKGISASRLIGRRRASKPASVITRYLPLTFLLWRRMSFAQRSFQPPAEIAPLGHYLAIMSDEWQATNMWRRRREHPLRQRPKFRPSPIAAAPSRGRRRRRPFRPGSLLNHAISCIADAVKNTTIKYLEKYLEIVERTKWIQTQKSVRPTSVRRSLSAASDRL
jgi:hypothetical protein